jgi:hypothetical protein
MNKQKGVAVEDIVAIASDDYHCLTLSVGFPGSEQYTISKNYSGKQDYLSNVEKDISDYQKSLAHTVFMVEDSAMEEEAVVVNDSWGAIWKDAKMELKSKLFARH